MPFKTKEEKRKYDKKYRNENREKINEKTRNYRRNQWKRFREYKQTLYCVDCGLSGEKYPEILDFDHVRGKKIDSLARMKAGSRTFERLMIEIKKCDPVCSNCHRIRTVEREKINGAPAAKYWKAKKAQK